MPDGSSHIFAQTKLSKEAKKTFTERFLFGVNNDAYFDIACNALVDILGIKAKTIASKALENGAQWNANIRTFGDLQALKEPLLDRLAENMQGSRHVLTDLDIDKIGVAFDTALASARAESKAFARV